MIIIKTYTILHPEDYTDNQLVYFYDWNSLYIISAYVKPVQNEK